MNGKTPEGNHRHKKLRDEQRYSKFIFLTEIITWILIALFTYWMNHGRN